MQPGGSYFSVPIDEQDFYDVYLNLTMEETIAIAHQPQDLIKHCGFAGVPVYPPYCKELIEGAVKLFSPAIGVCYGFNFRNTSRKEPFDLYNGTTYTLYSGRQLGLQLVLNIEG